MREIIFTHQCAGDLGVALRVEGGETQVVAMFFTHYSEVNGEANAWTIHYIHRGGPSVTFKALAYALNEMLEEAERIRKSDG